MHSLMPWRIHLALWRGIFVISWILLHQANAQMIDDTNPSITYTGTWLTTEGPNHINNTVHYTKVKGSALSLTFRNVVQVRLFGLGITNPTVDSMVGIIFDGIGILVNNFSDEGHFRRVIWDSGTTLDPTVYHTLACVKTSADGDGMDLYIDAFGLTPFNSTTVPVVSTTLTETTSVAQTTSGIVSSSSMTNISVLVDHSTFSTIILGLPINSQDSASPTAGPTSTASTSETASIVTKGTGMSNAVKIGIALGTFVFICLCSAIFFLLGRQKRLSDSFKHLTPYQLGDNHSNGLQDTECGEMGRGMDTDAVYGLNCTLGTSAVTGSIPETSLDAIGPPPYSVCSAGSDSSFHVVPYRPI
ncbi:hypothetical protein FRC15_010816 [Serendipita sp. 397]|nr:hypothetical protein FRC15_010816 [Serendipita sp. 397]